MGLDILFFLGFGISDDAIHGASPLCYCITLFQSLEEGEEAQKQRAIDNKVKNIKSGFAHCYNPCILANHKNSKVT